MMFLSLSSPICHRILLIAQRSLLQVRYSIIMVHHIIEPDLDPLFSFHRILSTDQCEALWHAQTKTKTFCP